MNLICLDLDGTLEDSRDDMTASIRRVRAALGLPARKDEALRPWVNQGMDTLYQNAFDDFFAAGGDAARLEAAYEADYSAHLTDATRLYPGVRGALDGLHALGRLAVVTNKPEALSRRLLERLGVDGFFSAVIGGDTCVRPKPDPVMLRAAAEECAFAPARGQVVMIGDTDGDVKMGQAHGAATVWCAWGYVAAPKETPDASARTPDELPVVVQKLLQKTVSV